MWGRGELRGDEEERSLSTHSKESIVTRLSFACLLIYSLRQAIHMFCTNMEILRGNKPCEAKKLILHVYREYKYYLNIPEPELGAVIRSTGDQVGIIRTPG